MNLLHTADWHLGHTFYAYDRKAEHLQFFAFLKAQIKEHAIDVLLVAGDVFDSPNPSAESQRIFYAFLRDVTAENPQLQIIITAGNHDSAARLEAPNSLLEAMNITIRGTIKRTDTGNIDLQHLIIPLTKAGRPVAYCLAVPYLRQGDCPEAETHSQGVAKLYEALYAEVKHHHLPIIAMGHLQATGSEISVNDRAERTIIGGLECIPPDAFSPEIAYTALGHLHRTQRVSKRENIRYSGTPIPMSFAEKNNKHGVIRIEITANGTHIHHIEFTAPVKLLTLPGTPKPLAAALLEIESLPDGPVTDASPFLEIKILLTEPEPSLRHQIEEALKGKAVRLARIESFTPKSERDPSTFTCEDLQAIDPFNAALDIFHKRFGGEDMPPRMKELLQSVIREEE